ERDEVRAVVRQHRLEGASVGGAEVVHVDRGDLPSLDIAGPGRAEDRGLDGAEAVRAEDPVPEAAGGMDEVGVVIDRRRAKPREHESGFQDWPVESLAVEGDEAAGDRK